MSTNVFAGLRVHPSNPRYFTDSSRRAIYLGGHQIYVDQQDNTFDKTHTHGFQELLDWPQYIQFAKERNLNYVRNWNEFTTGSGSGVVASPMPYRRVSGYGNPNAASLNLICTNLISRTLMICALVPLISQ